jgi:hypothetical protein
MYDPLNQKGVVNMGAMAFKSNVPRFKKRLVASESNPNIGPGVYSVCVDFPDGDNENR